MVLIFGALRGDVFGQSFDPFLILNTRGTSPRVYRNMLAFVAPDQDTLLSLQTEVRRLIAWQSIITDAEELNLDGNQNREAQSKM